MIRADCSFGTPIYVELHVYGHVIPVRYSGDIFADMAVALRQKPSMYPKTGDASVDAVFYATDAALFEMEKALNADGRTFHSRLGFTQTHEFRAIPIKGFDA